MGHRHAALCAAFLFFSGAAVTTAAAAESQEGEEADGQPAGAPVFPIHRLWEDAQKNAVRWQPDWPPAIPPDSFDPVSSGKARRVTITVRDPEAENGSPAIGGAGNAELPPARSPASYTVRRDAEGRFVEFPFLRDGIFYQASMRYGRDRVVEAMTLALSSDESDESTESIEIIVLTTDERRPKTARIKTGGASYFASFLWQADACVEMWTDETGIPLEVLRDERIFHYDSMQNITSISFPDGVNGARDVSAYYNDKGPRYWTRAGTTLSFQRDETGLIIHLEDIRESGDDAPQPPANSSYEYAFDQNGNWTERREIRWTKLNGYLVPREGTVITRLIEYNEPASVTGQAFP
ncbi:MAG: hypothetical protein LBE74_01365 [Treponema sp.]|nr:hypothetical protein [Treponema sp.]